MWSYEIHEDNRATLARVLRGIRETLGWTQQDLAGQLGQPQSFVSKYESGTRRLELPELDTISKALGKTLVDVVKRYEDEKDNAG